MIRPVLSFLCAILFLAGAHAQPDDKNVVQSLYFIGDAGEPFIINSSIGDVIRNDVETSGIPSTVLFLGDNIYPKGMPDADHKKRAISEKIIETQANWIRGTPARGIFIPGNHDWQKGKRHGWQQIMNQQHWIDSLNDKQITLLPRDGCPGPIEVPIGKNALLVIIDTQWFLQPENRPEGEESSCDAKTPGDALLLLNDIFVRNTSKRIIIAAHHPLITYGEHGGVFTAKDHLFPLTAVNPRLYVPLPLVGSLYPLYRKWMGDIQDTAHPTYKDIITQVTKLMAQYPGTIYAAGHEHTLQAIVKDSSYFIVSGAGVKTTSVKKKKYARFAVDKTGFVKINILNDGGIQMVYFQVDADFPKGKIVFRDSLPAFDRFFRKAHAPEELDFAGKVVKVRASRQYHAGKGKKRFLGENYRDAWEQEIKKDT